MISDTVEYYKQKLVSFDVHLIRMILVFIGKEGQNTFSCIQNTFKNVHAVVNWGSYPIFERVYLINLCLWHQCLLTRMQFSYIMFIKVTGKSNAKLRVQLHLLFPKTLKEFTYLFLKASLKYISLFPVKYIWSIKNPTLLYAWGNFL
jgi:hypothetical protein